VTMIRGHHVLHFGGEYTIFQDNSTAWGNIVGASTSFAGTYTQCTYCVAAGTSSKSGNAFADFLLGDINNWNANQTPQYHGRQKAPQVFVQDDWKIRPNLTINLGLRYQVMMGWSDTGNNQRTFDPLVTNDTTHTAGAMWYAANADHGRKNLQDNVYDTFLPRLGFALQLNSNTVLRGGYGLYAYLWTLDTYGSGEGSAYGSSGSLNDKTSGFTPLGTLSGTNDNFTYVSSPTANNAYNSQNVDYNRQDTPVARIQQYNLTLERSFGPAMSVSLAYVGSNSANLSFSRDINQVPQAKLSVNDSSYRPYPQFGNITGSRYDASANYNSMQAVFQRRMSRFVTLQTSYVWSKFLDDFDSSAWSSRGGTTTYQNAYDTHANYGASNFDVRDAFKGNATVLFPFGHGQPFLNNSMLLDEITGGWHLSSNFVAQTGNPFTVTEATNNSYAQSGDWYPNMVGNPKNAPRTIKVWYNVSAFQTPTVGTFGNNHRNNVYGPNLVFVDLSMGKTFNLYRDVYKFQIRVDANNALNHPGFALPGTSLGSGSEGTITNTIVGGRTLQLGARFSF
jgi:hypothetical protein